MSSLPEVERPDRDPVVVTIERAHSVWCGECGGWSSPALEATSDHSWFVLCDACGSILFHVRGLTAREEPTQP